MADLTEEQYVQLEEYKERLKTETYAGNSERYERFIGQLERLPPERQLHELGRMFDTVDAWGEGVRAGVTGYLEGENEVEKSAVEAVAKVKNFSAENIHKVEGNDMPTLSRTLDVMREESQSPDFQRGVQHFGGEEQLLRAIADNKSVMFKGMADRVADKSDGQMTADEVQQGAGRQIAVIDGPFGGDFDAYQARLHELSSDPKYAEMEFSDVLGGLKDGSISVEAVPVVQTADKTSGPVIPEPEVSHGPVESPPPVVVARRDEPSQPSKPMPPSHGPTDILSTIMSGGGIQRDDLHQALDDKLAQFDFNGDGVIGLGILQSILHAKGDALFDKIDVNGDGQIGFGFIEKLFDKGQGICSTGVDLKSNCLPETFNQPEREPSQYETGTIPIAPELPV